MKKTFPSKINAITLALALNGVAYAQQNTNDDDVIEEVVVFGCAAQMLKSVNMKREQSQVADFVGVDALGKLPDNNVAEAASRLPGISIIPNFETGEGQYVTIRGLDSALNTYSVNGVRMAASDEDRRISLQSLPPAGVKSISVTKTLTPNLDGDALGGAVDIQLFNAFDFDGFNASADLDYSYQDRSEKDGTQFSGAVSNVFNDNFGIYIGAYVTSKDIESEESENWGRWEPYRKTATNTYADQNTLMMQGDELDRYEKSLERYGVNFSFDYRYGIDNTVYLRGSYNDYTDEEVHRSLEMRNHPTLRTNGETSLYNEQGIWDPQGHRAARQTEFREETENLAVIIFGGEHTFSNLRANYAFSYATSDKKLPNAYGMGGGFNTVNLGEPGGILFDFPSVGWPQFNPNTGEQGLKDLQDMSKYTGVRAWDKWDGTTDKKLGAEADFTYEFTTGNLAKVDFGFKYSTSERDSNKGRVNINAADGVTLADPRIAGPVFESHLDGRYTGLRSLGGSLDINKVYNLIQSCDANFFANATCTLGDSNDDLVLFDEDIAAVYLMGTWNFGDNNEWEVISGVRYEYTEHASDALAKRRVNGDTTTSRLNEKADYDNLLPSVHVNYNATENLKIRGALWTSFTRPAYNTIAGQTTYNYDGDQLESISRKNINLQPQTSTNLDLSVEYYLETGIVSAAVYYKKLDDYISVDKSSGQNSQLGDVSISQPENLDEATIKGIELGYSEQFNYLPAPFDGLGINANVMFQSTESDPFQSWRTDRPPIGSAPDRTNNLEIYWEKHGWEARISYQYTDKYLQNPRDYGIDKYHQAVEYVDVNLSYLWEEHNLRISLEAKNLTEEPSYFTTSGSANRNMMDYVENGRSFNLGLSWSFK